MYTKQQKKNYIVHICKGRHQRAVFSCYIFRTLLTPISTLLSGLASPLMNDIKEFAIKHYTGDKNQNHRFTWSLL